MTTRNHHNRPEPDWAKLLDMLESESAPSGAADWSEEQQRQLVALRELLAETEDALTWYALLNVDEGWSQLRARARERQLIPSVPGTAFRTRRRIRWTRIAAAAALVLALSFGTYLLWQQTSLPMRQVVNTAHEIEPGRNRARLILSDGTAIPLREDQKGIAITEEGITYTDGEFVSADYQTTDNVHSVTLEVPRAGQYQVDLPDGTRVWLNSESALTYPTRFADNTRKVQLTGEAYFEVAHLPEQPFIVSTQTQEIKVLGTHFNIHAYLDEPVSTTTLVEGSVRVRLWNTRQELVLTPGEQAVTGFQSMRFQRADLDQVLAWKDGRFVFHGQDLASIMRQISRWYDIDVHFDHAELGQLRFGGTVSRDNRLSTVLEAMENTGNITFVVHGKTVIVRNAH